jgi:adenine phosphoribosyltransferase
LLLIDDVLATGGTMTASAELCMLAGYRVEALATLIDLGIVHDYHWRHLRLRTVITYPPS